MIIIMRMSGSRDGLEQGGDGYQEIVGKSARAQKQPPRKKEFIMT